MNRQKLLPTLLFLLLSALAYGQGWERMYTAPSLQTEAQIVKALPAPDGFLLLVSDLTLDLDFHISKIDAAGLVQWTHHFDFGGAEDAQDLIATSDGGYAVVYTSPAATSQTSHLVKLDDQFNVVFNQQLSGVGVTANLVMRQVEEAGGVFHVFGTYSPPNFGFNQGVYINVDAGGNMVGSGLWSPASTEFSAATGTGNGEFIAVANGYPGGPANNTSLVIARLTTNGSPNVWQKTVGDPNLPYFAYDIIPALGGGYLIAGAKGGNGLLLKIDELGNTLWEKNFPYQLDSLNFLGIGRLAAKTDGTGYLAVAGSDSYIPQIVLLQLDDQGNLQSRKAYGPFFKYNYANTLLALSDGALMGGSSSQLNDKTYPYAIRTGPNGQTFNSGVSGTVYLDVTGDCIADADSVQFGTSVEAWQGGNLVAAATIDQAGTYTLPLDAGDYDITVDKPSSAWTICGPDTIPVTVLAGDTVDQVDFVMQYNPVPVDSLFGSVFEDIDGDCVRDSFEVGHEGWQVVAVVFSGGLAQTFNAATDANGHFSISNLPGIDNSATGIFSISPPQGDGLNCQINCPDAFNISFQNGNSYEANFGVHCDSLPPCPLLDVDIATNGLRPCFSSNYSVHYCNLGAVVAEDATIVVILDSLEVISSSIPWVSVDGNAYTFALGDIAPEDCGDFTITVHVHCDDPVGQTYCVEAHGYPDTICQTAGANWDGSQIQVSGTCQGDSVVFLIKNVGDGNMLAPLEYIVVEDNVLLMPGGAFQLDAHETKSVSLEATGAFLRLQADQAPGFPAYVQPSAWVEGCAGNNPAGNFSMGYVNQYPFNDDDPWLDVFCLQSVNSFDPNDKQGFPIGYDDEHLIDRNTDIEYLIRFQNTGNAPAVNVEVRDSIPVQFLDPASVRPGASSHPYQWDMQGNGVVVFRFTDINLPDSSANAAASQGFVKFRVAQRADLPFGSVIKNEAAIYFDFNAPVLTNTTFHTIGENFIVLETADPHTQLITLKVSPNPSIAGTVKVQAQGWDSPQPLQFRLLSSLGRTALEAPFRTGGTLEFQADALPAGVYFYEVRTGNAVVGKGKLVKVK